MSMLNWDEYYKQLLVGMGEIGKISTDLVRGYRTLGGAASKTSLLGAKINELIALAVPVTAPCDVCSVVHTNAAIKAGATREEVVEALGTAPSINAGAELVYSTRVLDAY